MIVNDKIVKIGNKEYNRSNKIIMIDRKIKNHEYICRKCGSDDIAHCYSRFNSVDMPYCGNCGMYVADAGHKHCGFCGIKFEGEV